MRVPSSRAAAAALACAALAAPAAAEGGAPITLRWQAPEGCPDRAAVEARVAHLLGGAPAATDRTLEADGAVEGIPRGFRLELKVASGGAESTRVLQSVSCESLADAGALVIALAFDPEAVTAQEIKRAEAAGGAPAGSAPPAPNPAHPGGDAAHPEGDGDHAHVGPVSTAALIRIPVPMPLPPPQAPPPAPAPPPSPFSFGGFLAFSGDAGTLPSVAPGVRAGLSLGIGAFRIEPAFAAWPSSRSALPSLPGAGAELRLLAFALDGCRRLLPWSDADAPAAAFGCVGFEIGEIHGAGFGVPMPSSGGALWAAPKAAVRVELALARWAAITLDVGLAIPVDRKRFVLDLAAGRTVLHEPSPVSGRAGLGLALRL
jgi:hypothetical protein